MRPGFNMTGNRGNMIHSEAIMRLLDRNGGRSASGNLVHVKKQLGDQFAEEMSRQFDIVVLSMANMVTKNRDHTLLVEALNALDVPIYVFGVGMQDKLPEGAIDKLTPSTQELLKIFSKAEFFSVRGERTAAWLNSVGCPPHTVGGCPSLYAFPASVAGIDYRNPPRREALVTGGHISENNLNGTRPRFRRGTALIRAFRDTPASYVMQDEMFNYHDLVDVPGVFNPALDRLDAERLNTYIFEKLGVALPFQRYYFFDQPAAWRQAMVHYDAFVGDRFHGGVACLQVGVPAVFITSDQRMTELSEYYGAPATTFRDFDGTVEEVIPSMFTAENHDRFHETYRERLAQFRQDMNDAGLKLADDRPISEIARKP